MLVAFKRAGCGLALVALKRTGCDVWQLEYQASNVTASVQSDHLLHGYMLPVFSPLISRIVHHALLKFSPCRNKPLPCPRRRTMAMQIIGSTKQQ